MYIIYMIPQNGEYTILRDLWYYINPSLLIPWDNIPIRLYISSILVTSNEWVSRKLRITTLGPLIAYIAMHVRRYRLVPMAVPLYHE